MKAILNDKSEDQTSDDDEEMTENQMSVFEQSLRLPQYLGPIMGKKRTQKRIDKLDPHKFVAGISEQMDEEEEKTQSKVQVEPHHVIKAMRATDFAEMIFYMTEHFREGFKLSYEGSQVFPHNLHDITMHRSISEALMLVTDGRNAVKEIM